MQKLKLKYIVSTGVYPGLSNQDAKTIRLTNGVLFIMGLNIIAIGVFTMSGELFLAGKLQYSRFTGSSALLVGAICMFFIYLNKLRYYQTVKYSTILIFWMMITSMSIIYGKSVRIDLYYLVTMLIPFGMFQKRWERVTAITISIVLFILVNIIYFTLPPLTATPASHTNVWYSTHCIIMLTAVLGFVNYLYKQNKANETALSKEIEKHKNTSKKLKESNISKDKFFSVIAHDLKGPVGNFAHILNYFEQEKLPPKIYENLKTSSNNTYSMLEDLLTWARNQKKQIEFTPSDIDINKVFSNMIDFFNLPASEKKLNIRNDENSERLFAHANIPATTTIIRNLISNAIKFTNPGGDITLLSQKENNMIKISVTDTGVGMNEAKISKLFKLGERNISSPGTQNEAGSGLGLILCKDFVEANNGEIGIRSTEGIGTTFWFTIPIGKEVHDDIFIETIKSKKLKALVVEDNFLNLQTTANTLNLLGISIEIAQDGEEAILKGLTTPFDIIFLDITLPKYDGTYINKKIRNKYKDAKIVALSSFDKTEILEKDNTINFNDYLKKPLTTAELLECLKKLDL